MWWKSECAHRPEAMQAMLSSVSSASLDEESGRSVRVVLDTARATFSSDDTNIRTVLR